MSITEHQFKGFKGLPMYSRLWEPENEARALALIVHGHGEHSGRYTHVAETLVTRGFVVSAIDLRGHGHSQGRRGMILSWNEYGEDLRLWMKSLEHFSKLSTFLYGHSLGGTIILESVLREPRDYAGVIASAPVLSQPNIPAYLFSISRLLSRIYPSFSLSTQLDPTALSRDPEVVQKYREDPLVHSVGRARLGTELVEAGEWIKAHAEEWKLPILLIQGAKDRLVDPQVTSQFFETLGGVDKTFLAFPEGFHEPHNDLDKSVVFKRVRDWLEARL